VDSPDLNDGPIGIFGGSFDPPHLGHVALVRAAIDTLGLHEVWILPVGTPVHRSLSGKADGKTRLRWLEAIFSGEDHVRVLDWEVKRATATPTITSLKYFRSQYPLRQAVLLLGEDASAGMAGWVGYPEHCQLIDIAVFTRSGYAGRFSGLPEWQRAEVAEWRRQPGCGRQLLVEAQLPDISATEIRQRCAQGVGLYDMVPEQVRHAIEKIYREN